jgi:hypothetical protein
MTKTTWIMTLFSRFLKARHPVLLISFCNMQQAQASALLRYDTRDGSSTWVDMGHDQGAISISSVGLCDTGQLLLHVAILKNVPHAFAFDRKTLTLRWYQPLPDVQDPHSIAAADGRVYIVSTGSDEVIQYTLADDGLVSPNSLWTPSGIGQDTHHINSVTTYKGDVYVTGCGPKKGARWSTADDGYIYNITQDVFIKKQIYHPHTLIVHQDTFYYCDSSRAAFASLDKPLTTLEGYVRGAAFTSKHVAYIGTSLGRKISKSTGIVDNPADDGEDWGFCGVTRFDLRTKEQIRIDLTQYGREIYDIYHLA